MSETTNSMGN